MCVVHVPLVSCNLFLQILSILMLLLLLLFGIWKFSFQCVLRLQSKLTNWRNIHQIHCWLVNWVADQLTCSICLSICLQPFLYNFVLSTDLITQVGHCYEFLKLMFRALALHQSQYRNCGLYVCSYAGNGTTHQCSPF